MAKGPVSGKMLPDQQRADRLGWLIPSGLSYVTDRNVSLYVPALSTRKRGRRRDLQGRIDVMVTISCGMDHPPNQPRPDRGMLHHGSQQARQCRPRRPHPVYFVKEMESLVGTGA